MGAVSGSPDAWMFDRHASTMQAQYGTAFMGGMFALVCSIEFMHPWYAVAIPVLLISCGSK